jgi:aqualysin 1
MGSRCLALALFLGFLVTMPGIVATPQPAATFPVIVVFDDQPGVFNLFEPSYRADQRARANPPAWNYVDPGVAGFVQYLESLHGFRAVHVYSAALRGFAGRLTAPQIVALENDPMVAYVEPDGTMSIVQRPSNPGSGGGGDDPPQVVPWGVERIGAKGKPPVTTVNAYIIDTGIDAGHRDLHVVDHVNFAGGPNRDCHGHGTHVAGTVAAIDNDVDVVGVAPGAPLTGVKVLGCGGTGSTSGVIKGVDWVTADAQTPAIANMSLGGGASAALDTAVKNSADSGVFYSIAAGNSGADACDSSPARAGVYEGVMTTAATDSNDQEASWSNYGPCVDVWAPGVSILSTKQGGGTTTLSGTSMAAPHVGGTGALYLAWQDPSASAAEVEAALNAKLEATVAVSKDGLTTVKLVNAGPF